MTDPKSPSLEVISKFSGNPFHERRKLPRITLTTEQFRLDANGRVYSVSDLSQEGLAIRVLDAQELGHFTIGRALAGTLNLRGLKFSVELKVMNLAALRVGCRFENVSKDLRVGLTLFLDPEALGRELRPMPSSDESVVWYRGYSGTDLLLRRGDKKDGEYSRVTLFFLGIYVQWEAGGGVSTGSYAGSPDQVETHGLLLFETMLLDRDPRVDTEKLSIAKKLLMSSNLPQDLKNWCLQSLGDHHGS